MENRKSPRCEEKWFALAKALQQASSLKAKKALLLAFEPVKIKLQEPEALNRLILAQTILHEVVVLSLFAIGQADIVLRGASEDQTRSLFKTLAKIELFYENLGGVVGYHSTVCRLLQKKGVTSQEGSFDRPFLQKLDNQTVKEGLEALPHAAEVYPIGGVGERLQLTDENGEPQPAALLPFLGRTLLEGLIRDVVAREYLYFKLYDRQLCTPLSIMTSLSKDNHEKIKDLFEKKKWFGRPQSRFRLLSQPHVPVITKEGHWSMKGVGELNLKPGGHGALWRVAQENDLFSWLEQKGCRHLLIRQINNPLACQDRGLLAFLGTGKKRKATFGFASCERPPHAAEGVLVLCHDEKGRYSVRNIEYTDLLSYGIEDKADLNRGKASLFPTNTNVLYANIEALKPILRQAPMPGLMLNMKSDVPFIDEKGVKSTLLGGRLESRMQNISDVLTASTKEELKTFITYSKRGKLMSTAKRKWTEGKPLLETPQGAYFDLLQANHALLQQQCSMRVPPFGGVKEFIQKGPPLIFLYHGALGPLYSIIAQKIRGGEITFGSELNLEVSELLLDDLILSGSLLIEAKNVVGHCNALGQQIYSNQTGKCVLKQVRVQNEGIDASRAMDLWKGEGVRKESLTILLKGCAEFYAQGVTIKGHQSFEVPDKQRWILTSEGLHKEKIDRSSPLHHYSMSPEGRVLLQSSESSPLQDYMGVV